MTYICSEFFEYKVSFTKFKKNPRITINNLQSTNLFENCQKDTKKV